MKNEYKVEGQLVKMNVQGKEVTIDYDDINKVGLYKWRTSGRSRVFTSYWDKNKIVRTMSLHKYLTGSPHVKYLNNDPFDLRRSNLLPVEKQCPIRKRGAYLKGNRVLLKKDVAIIYIDSKGSSYRVYIDVNDYPVVKNYTWCRNVKTGYAQSIDRITRKGVYMHRLIMDARGFYNKTDHIDGNRLNNRKSNLRICDDSENHHNNIKHRNVTSGIYPHTKGKYWTACLIIKKRNIYLQKTFKTHEQAIAQRRKWEEKLNPSGLQGRRDVSDA